jgi:hypothetical protein
MVCGRNGAGVAQPDDSLFAVTDFGAIMMVRFKFVRLCVTVNQGMWVIGVGLMEMLTRHDRGTDKPGHKGKCNYRAPKPNKHVSIMVRQAHKLITPELGDSLLHSVETAPVR